MTMIMTLAMTKNMTLIMTMTREFKTMITCGGIHVRGGFPGR